LVVVVVVVVVVGVGVGVGVVVVVVCCIVVLLFVVCCLLFAVGPLFGLYGSSLVLLFLVSLFRCFSWDPQNSYTL